LDKSREAALIRQNHAMKKQDKTFKIEGFVSSLKKGLFSPFSN
jgi:hypothetical protein